MRFSGSMPTRPPPDSGPRLSSIAGLQKAGIIESFVFDGTTGLVGVAYTPSYLRLLKSDRILFAEPGFVAAVQIDDPVAMRMWVEREAAFLAEEASPSGPKPKRSRGKKGSR